MQPSIEEICHCLDILVSTKNPIVSKDGDTATSLNIESALKTRTDSLVSYIESCGALHSYITSTFPHLMTIESLMDINWRFVEWCLYLLVLLKQSLDEAAKSANNKSSPQLSNAKSDAPPLPGDVLSVQQQKLVSSALQFIVGFGIWPSLLPSLRKLVKCRSKFGDLLFESQPLMSCQKAHRRNVACIVSLLVLTKHPTIGTLILSHHLGDILASLFQICHAPIKKKAALAGTTSLASNVSSETSSRRLKFEEEETLSDITHFFIRVYEKDQSDSDLIDETWNDREMLTQKLDCLINRVYQPLLIKELLILQGAPMSKSKNETISSSSPSWLRKACGEMLSSCLMKQEGILAVIQTFLQFLPDSNSSAHGSDVDNADWMKYESLAKLIALAPSKCPTNEYYHNISAQVLSLICQREHEVSEGISIQLRIGSRILFYMAENQPQLMQCLIMEPLLKPILTCINFDNISGNEVRKQDPEGILVQEQELCHCIEVLHKILICGVPSSKFIALLYPVVHCLFNLATDCQDKITYLRGIVEDILAIILKNSEVELAVKIIEFILFGSPELEGFKKMSPNISFCLGDSGGMKAVIGHIERTPEYWLYENEQRINCIMGIMQKLGDKKFVGTLFLCLLQRLTSVVTTDSNEKSTEIKATDVLLSAEIQEAALSNNLLLLGLLQQLIESYDESLSEDEQQAIHFIKATLERGSQMCCSQVTTEGKQLENETLMLAMGALVMLIEKKDTRTGDWNVLKCCLPGLDHLYSSHPDEAVKNMANELRTAIRTHGIAGKVVPQTNVQEPSPSNPLHSAPDVSQKEITRADENASPRQYHQQAPSDTPLNTAAAGSNELPLSPYQQACKELQDPLLPVKGHALIALKNLILKRDPETLENKEKLLQVFQEHLGDPDSYIYLPAVQGLAALGDISDDKILPVLTTEFVKVGGSRSTELRLKLGEALVRCTQNLGDMVFKYRDLLLGAFLCGAKDKDPLLRSSSLSNLGEVCKHLRFSLGPYIQEILCCLESLIKTDPSKEVRRAAIMVLTDIFRGTGKDVLKVLENEMISIYRLLKSIYSSSNDDVLKLHAQLALEEIRDIMFSILQSKPPLVKEIKILDSY